MISKVMLSRLFLQLASRCNLYTQYRQALILATGSHYARGLCSAAQLKHKSEPTATLVKEDTINEPVVHEKPASDFSKELGPCVLGLFTGRINKNLLVYPELDTMPEVEAVHKLAEPVEKFFAEEVDSKQLDASGHLELPTSLLSGLGRLGLFGQTVSPELAGGGGGSGYFGLSAVARARIAEATSADAGAALCLRAHHSLGLAALLEADCPAPLLRRLAPDLAAGRRLAAFCLAEPGGGGGFADPLGSVRATAELAADDVDGGGSAGAWRLNGSKVWVTNGPLADVFVVFALTSADNDEDRTPKRLSAFLVERSHPGVSVGPPEPMLGARTATVGALHLDNALVPAENLLGQLGDGLRLARRAVTAGRLAAGPAVAGALKRLVADAAARCTARRPGGVPPLCELPLVQRRLARLTGLAYAVESVAYMTAFLADQFPGADLGPEAAALSLLSTRALRAGAAEAATLAGGRACAVGEFDHERRLRDAWTLAAAESPADVTRLQLAGRGVKFAAKQASDAAHKFMTARGFFRRMRLFNAAAIGPESGTLGVHYHHNMASVANSIEVNAESFARAVRYCLLYYRQDLPQEQILMSRMADCAVDLFALLACCARASRSKSIGLRSADHELDLLVMLSKEAALRLEHNLSGLDMDKLYARHADSEFRRVSDYACKFGGYSVDHAISRNWN